MAIEWKYANRRNNNIGADEALNAGLDLELAPYRPKEVVADSQGRYVGQNGYTVDDLDMVGTGRYINVTDWLQMPDGYSKVGNPYAAATPDQVAQRKQQKQVAGENDVTLMGDESYNTVLNAQANWKEYTALADQAEAAGNPELAAEYRAKAANEHDIAEAERAKYGYSGGADGSEHLGLMAYTGGLGYDDVGGGNGGRGGSGGYGYDPYKSRYQARIDALTDAILNREAFAYDKEQDPLYQQYRDSYTRGGQRGMQDTLAQVSARTGGMASSYAETAAQQTYNNFMAELADKVPELQQLAYGQYMDNIAMDRADLQMLLGLDDTAYGRWSDDRNFDYGAYRDSVGDSQWAQQFAYRQAQDALAQQNWQTQWDYQQAQDALARQDTLARLQAAGNPGRTPYTPTTDEDVVGDGVIPASMLQALQANYSDGNMPADAWNKAVQLYGEEALTAAGFRQQQANKEISDYQFVVNQLNSMARAGVSYKDILYDLEDARKSGLLTESEYQALKKKYAE